MKRNVLLLITTGLVLFSAVTARAEKTVRCESNDNRYHECTYGTPGKVKLEHKLSDDSCELGRSWGVKNDHTLWVDRGCRAEFVIKQKSGNRGRGEITTADRSNGSTVRCESQDNRRKQCAADTRYGAQISRQLSKDRCIEGRDWGYDSRGVWVDHGCRADFLLSSGNDYNSVPASVVLCESKDDHRKQCAADTRYGAQLSRQLSKDRCVEGRDWGYDSNGIWVDHGCRAEFTINGMR